MIVNYMSAERKASPILPEALICVDYDNKELFPAELLVRAASLPTLLDNELGYSGKETVEHVEDIRVTASNLATSHINVQCFHEVGGTEFIRQRRIVCSNLAKRVERSTQPSLLPNYGQIKDAVRSLTPAETDYYIDLSRQRRQLTPQDHMKAAAARQVPILRRVISGSPRLQENTPENLKEYREIAEAFNSYLLLELQMVSAQALLTSTVTDDKRDLRSAIGLHRRLKNLACDRNMTSAQKIEAHNDIYGAVSLLASATAEQLHAQGQARLAEYTTKALSALQYLCPEYSEVACVTNYIVEGRQLRLQGDTAPVAVAEQPKQQEEPAEPETVAVVEQAPPESPKPKEPDYKKVYAKRFQALLETIQCRQPELLPAKEIKRRGLDQARAALVRGEKDDDGVEVVSGCSKTEAQRLISNIEFFRDFIAECGDMDTAKSRLEQSAADVSGVLKGLGSFFEEAGSKLDGAALSGLRANTPNIRSIEELATEMKENWGTVSWFVHRYWPGGQKTTRQLHQLIFTSFDGETAAETQTA